ncbi:MAG: hypothetical protein JOS17DRAFT_825986, partial [Linnemannia elongata]
MTIINRRGKRPGQAANATARAYLRKRRQSRGASSTQHSTSRPGTGSPPVSLVQFDNTTLVEYALHKLRWQRLEEAPPPVFISPMAKTNLQALDEDIFPLMEKVQEFLASGRQVMLILGDSGAGKTTFNRYLERQLWTAYQNGNPIPLFINLPASDRPDKDLIGEHLKTNNFSVEQIQEMKQYRQFVIICDGYDESQLTVNLHTVNLFNRPGQWNTKMVISCRTQYLGKDYRGRFIPDGASHYSSLALDLFQEAVIAPFNKGQIENYGEQYVPLEPRTWTTKDYMDKLTTIPNLMELVTNPFLLSLSLEALPGVTKGIQEVSAIKITRVQLYDTFIRHWLAVNSRRLQRSVLSKKERAMLDDILDAGFISTGIAYATRLASAIFEHQDGNPVVQYVHIKDKTSWRAEFFGPQPKARMLRESSPVHRIGSQYRFLHRSMLEYFLSCAVYDPSGHGVDNEFFQQPCPDPTPNWFLPTDGPLFKRNLLTEPSIIQFLCERVKEHPDFKNQLLAVIEQSKTDASAATAAANAITILVRAEIRFNSADLRGIRIPGADLSDGQFDYVQFQGADLRGVNFARSWLRQVDFSEAQMDGVRFEELPYLKEHAAVDVVAFSSDGKLFAVALRNKSVITYDTTTWTRVRQQKEQSEVLAITFSPNNRHLAFGSRDKACRLWDTVSGDTLLVMKGHTGGVDSVAFSPCGKQIASASIDRTIRLWSSETGECLFVLSGHEDTVLSARYSLDGRRLVSGSNDGTIRVWDPETGEPEVDWAIPCVGASCVALSADGRQFAVMAGSRSGEIHLMDAITGEEGLILNDNAGWLSDIAFSPSGELIVSSNGLKIASGDLDGIVRLWEVNSNRSISNTRKLVAKTRTVAYTPDGLSIISYHDDNSTQRWDSSTGASRSIPSSLAMGVRSVAISPNGHWFASSFEWGIIRLLNAQTGVVERVLFGTSGYPVVDMSFSRCGRWLASCDSVSAKQFWDLESTDDQGKVVGEKDDLSSARGSVVFSPVGDQIAVRLESMPSRLRLFDLQVPDLRHPLKEVCISDTPRSMNYSPDGQRLVLGTSASSVLLWDLHSDKPDVKLEGHTDAVICVAYSPCGKWIFSGSCDKTFRLWSGEADSWSCVTVVSGCSEAVTSIAWNPVVPLEFVAGSADGSVRVWRISGAEEEELSLRMHWGTHIGQLCAADLTFKVAVGLTSVAPIYLAGNFQKHILHTTGTLAMSDHPLDQLDPHTPSSDSANSITRTRKRDTLRKFYRLSKSKTKEVEIKTSNHSQHFRPSSQHSTRPANVVSQANNLPPEDNQSIPPSTAEEKVLSGPLSSLPVLETIYAEDFHRSTIKTELPQLQQRIETTQQLVYCNTLLLQNILSRPRPAAGEDEDKSDLLVLQEPTLDETELDWLEREKGSDGSGSPALAGHSGGGADSTKIAEVVALGPVLEKDFYHKLLVAFIKEFDDAHPQIVRERLKVTHQQSTEHSYHLTLAVSRILDVMAEHKVQDLDRVLEHEPLSAILSELKVGSSCCVETLDWCGGWLAKVSAVFKLDLASVLEGLGTLQEALKGAVSVTGTVYKVVSSLMKSGRGVFDRLQEGLGSGQKRPWYPAVKAAYAFAHAGQLKDLRQLIVEAPCRHDHFFQWGISQLLGEISVDSLWSVTMRQQAITLLGHLHQHDQDWGQDESAKTWMLTIITKICVSSDQDVSDTAHSVLKNLGVDQSALIKHPYPLRSRLPIPDASPLLAKAQSIQYLEYELHKFRLQRLEEVKLPVYISPMAKANLQARDDETFPLKEKVQEFLASERQVMLILGDSGAGKSTFNKHLECELLQSYTHGGPIPLFINLPAIDEPDRDMIVKQLRSENFNDEQIRELKLHHQLILICDGYDESQQLVNLHKTNMLNQPGQWDTKMIISCRSQYLGQDYRSRFMPQSRDHYSRAAIDLFQEAVITPFSKRQIEDYIEQYVPLEPRTWTTKDYIERLTAIPNLIDLVKNPFLLSLSLEALPLVTEGKLDLSTIDITRVKLLASAIFEEQEGNPVIRYTHLKDKHTWRVDFFGPDPEVRLLRESSPLTRSGSLFRFLHRSIQEYFYSRTVFDPSSQDDLNEFGSQSAISSYGPALLDANGTFFKRVLLAEPLVIQFLCERVNQHPDFEKQLLAIIEQSKIDTTAATAATNAITILVRAGVRFNNADLRGIRIPGADLSDGQFDYAQFQGADLTGVNFARSWLRQVDFSDARMGGVRFEELPYLKENAAIEAQIASASDDSTIRLWSSETGECLFVLSGHENTVLSVAYSADGRRLVSGSNDGTIRVWDPETGASEPGWVVPHVGASPVVLSADGRQFGLMAGRKGGEIHLVDAVTGAEGLILSDDATSLTDIAFSPIGRLIVSSSKDRTVRLWDSSSGQRISRLSGHSSQITTCTFTPYGLQIASGDLDGIIRLWEVNTNRSSSLIQQYTAMVQTVTYSHDGLNIISDHLDDTIRLWDFSTGVPRSVVLPSDPDVISATLSPNGHWFAGGCKNGKIRLLSTLTDVVERVLIGATDYPIVDMRFSRCGRWLASRYRDGAVMLWDLESTDDQGKVMGEAANLVRPKGYMVFSPVGDQFAVGLVSDTNRSSLLRLFDLRATDLCQPLKELCLSVAQLSMDYSPDGQRLVLCTGTTSALLWDLQSDKPDIKLEGHHGTVLSVAYSPCGKWILSGSGDRTIRLWSGEVD